MKILIVVLLIGLHKNAVSAVPVAIINDIPNSLDGSNEIDEDDFTTHGLEHLSSAATCLVAGVEYTHGQQIYRIDPCEFCLCLDGEMFCWWQDCPPTMEGPCRERGPFSPCDTTLTTPDKDTTDVSFENFTTDNSNDTLNGTEVTLQEPKTCLVMGHEYKIGDKLPQNTGNCVECICGQGAKVSCSPHQCAPADDLEYHPAGDKPHVF